jgi:hypothetical protein
MNDSEKAAVDLAPSAGDRWRKAGMFVGYSTSALTRFKTLRDMQVDSYIPPNSLQFIKKLGEGAFASVEQAWCVAASLCRWLKLAHPSVHSLLSWINPHSAVAPTLSRPARVCQRKMLSVGSHS